MKSWFVKMINKCARQLYGIAPISVMAVAIFLTVAEAADYQLQRFEDYQQQYGDTLQNDHNGNLQTIENYTPKYGDYYKSEGSGDLQHYESYVPHYGHTLKNEGNVLQEYEKYAPVYGDYYE